MPGEKPGEYAAEIIRYISAKYERRGYLAGDRVYNNSNPENFQNIVRQLGYKLLFDYRIDQLGVQAQHAGAIQVEGTWYCPSMPMTNINATKDLRAGRIDEATWQTRIDERVNYELRGHDKGYGRWACPALGKYPSAASSATAP